MRRVLALIEPRSPLADLPNHMGNSNRPGQPKLDQSVPPTAEEYAERVAGSCMAYVDQLPAAYRESVNAFGYVDVVRAYQRGIPPAVIRDRALRCGGLFVL